MAATLDDLFGVLTEIRNSLEDVSDQLSTQNQILRALNTDSGGGLAVGAESQPASKKEKESTGSKSGGGTAPAQKQVEPMSGAMRNVMAISSSFTGSASNPFTPTSAAALSTAINMGPNTAGALTEALSGSQLAGETARQSAVAAVNLAGPRELQFVVDQTTKDLQSTLSSLADQGIEVSDEKAQELAGAFEGRARRKARALKQAAGAIDASIGGAANAAAGGIDNKQAEEMVQTLKNIERNTKNNVEGGAPSAEMRE